MKGNNTIKRITKALSKLQYQIINGKRLDVFMKKYNFQRIPYYGNESDNYTRIKYFDDTTCITIYAREYQANIYELLGVESIKTEKDVKDEIVHEIMTMCLNHVYSIMNYGVNDAIMSLGGYDIFDDISYYDLVNVNESNTCGSMVHCVPYVWFDFDPYSQEWEETKLYFDVLVEYKIDKYSLKKINDINNSDIDYSDIDWEQEFRNGTLKVVDILGF